MIFFLYLLSIKLKFSGLCFILSNLFNNSSLDKFSKFVTVDKF